MSQIDGFPMLSFYMDDRYNFNAFDLMFYPADVEYPRPFRYRPKYIQDQYQSKLGEWIGKECLICGKLKSGETLPIRFATIIAIDEQRTRSFIRFKLGPLVKSKSFSDISSRIEQFRSSSMNETLVEWISGNLAEFLREKHSGSFWNELATTLSEIPPYKPAMFLRLTQVSTGNSLIQPESIESFGESFRLPIENHIGFKFEAFAPSIPDEDYDFDEVKYKVSSSFFKPEKILSISSRYDSMDLDIYVKETGSDFLRIELIGEKGPALQNLEHTSTILDEILLQKEYNIKVHGFAPKIKNILEVWIPTVLIFVGLVIAQETDYLNLWLSGNVSVIPAMLIAAAGGLMSTIGIKYLRS